MTNEQLFRILIEEGFSKGDVSVFNKYAFPLTGSAAADVFPVFNP